MILETEVDRLRFQHKLMTTDLGRLGSFVREAGIATHLIAYFLARLAALLLLEWSDHSALSRLASQAKKRTVKFVQLAFPG